MKFAVMVSVLCVVAACAEDDPARHLPDATAVDAVANVEITVSQEGNGSGTVTSLPAGISCGSDCTAAFSQNTTVTLTATPAEGSVFAGWSGACNGGSTTCDVTLDGVKAVTATFELEKHTVTLVKAGQGTGAIHGDGVDCTGTCTVEVDHGAMLSFTAAPTGLSVFGGWGGSCSGSAACNVTVTADLTIQANFALDDFTVSVVPAGAGTGTVTSTPAGISCGATCQHSFTANQMVTLTATAATGSTFAGWSGACTGTAACVVTIDGSKTATATFTLDTYELTVMTNGSGSGVVASSPAGIDCGSDCTHDYNYGATVTLTATPTTGSVFGSWGGACSGTGATCTVAITSAKAVTATFTLTSQMLTVTKTGSGTVTSAPSGINCGATCNSGFGYGTPVTLTAVAASGYVFTGWGGACSGTGSCAVSMTSAQTVTATFVPQYTLSVTKTGSGTVTSNPTGINCGTNCSAAYVSATSVTLTPAAATGYVFTGWGGACTGTGSCMVSMTQARTVSATFTPQYTLTVAKSGSGTVTSSPSGINCGATCSATVTSGNSLTLTATPASGYVFTGWSGGGCSGTGSCSVTVTANTTVTATFTPQYTLTVAKSGSGTVTSSPSGINCGTTCSATVTSGNSFTLTATPASGYVFTGWSGGGCSGTGTCSVTVNANTTVTATFAQVYTLSVTKSGLGTVTSNPSGINCGATCGADFVSGTAVTLSAAAQTGYAFTGWTGAGINCPGTGTCTVSMTQAWSVTATFTKLVTLTVTKTGDGSGTVAGGNLNCGNTCTQSVLPGTVITLTATPSSANATASTFSGWSAVGCSGTGNCTVTVTSDTSVSAGFKLKPNIMFVSSGIYPGDFGGVNAADTICQKLASDAGLAGTYRAYLSYSTSATTHVNAEERFAAASGWVRVDQSPMMNSVSEMHTSVANTPSLTEKGVDITQTAERFVWTATFSDGNWWNAECAPQGAFGPWTTTVGVGGVGIATATNSGVVYQRYQPCDTQQRLYCLGIDRKASLQ